MVQRQRAPSTPAGTRTATEMRPRHSLADQYRRNILSTPATHDGEQPSLPNVSEATASIDVHRPACCRGSGRTSLAIATRLVAMLTGPLFGTWIDRWGEKSMLGALNIIYIVALAGYALIDNVWVAAVIYLVYAVVFPLSSIGSATYLRKVAVREEIAPSLAMGVTLSHAAAIIVPITTGYILNYVSYQVPFLIACVFATFAIFVTRRLDPRTQRSPARIAEDEAYEATMLAPQPAPATGNGGT